MPFQPVANIFSCEVRFTLADSAPAEWQFNMRDEVGSLDQARADNLAVTVDAWVSAQVRPNIAAAYTYREVRVRGEFEEFAPESINNTNTGTGGVAGVPLPNECALRLKFSTGLTGRSARGGVYLLPPIPSQMQTPNRVTAGYLGIWNTVFQALLTTLDANNWTLSVVQRWADNVQLSAGLSRPVLTIAAVDDFIDSQRGRKPRP